MNHLQSETELPVIFTPQNEPYLGLYHLLTFDQMIVSIMKKNAKVAPRTHGRPLNDKQRMACQVIPQAISIMLAIRELIRQGYLFGAHVLKRAFVERAVILLYIHHYPEEIEKWNRGWERSEAPSLGKMFEAIQEKSNIPSKVKGCDLTSDMNSLLHGKPDSAPWNFIFVASGGVGHASSKILDRPDLCENLCIEMIPWSACVAGMISAYFPELDS